MNEVEILLVEDNPSDAEMAIRVLKKNNLAERLLHVKDGAEALDFIYAQGEYAARKSVGYPKVILLDIKMPKVNGIEVLKKIKSDENVRKIPVVVFTSSKEDPDVQACYDLGVNSYIVKPVQFDTYVKTVSDMGLYWIVFNQPPVS